MESTLYNNISQLENGLPRERIIVLKAIYKTKNGKYTINPAYSKKLQWYKGVPRLSEEEKRGLSYYVTPSSEMVITDGVTFDMNNEIDRANWEWVKHSGRIAMTFEEAQNSPGCMFYVHIEEREAEVSVSQTELLYKALKYVMDDQRINYPNRARLMGVDMRNENPIVIEEFLLRRAKDEPQSIIDIYESSSLSIQLLFYDAIDKGIIRKEGSVFKYGGHILGADMDLSVAFLQESRNAYLVNLIERDVNPGYGDLEVEPLPELEEKPVIKATPRKKTTKK